MTRRKSRQKSTRRLKKRWVFRTPFGRQVGEAMLIALVLPIVAAAAGLVLAGGVGAATSRPHLEPWAAVAGAGAVFWLAFRNRGWPAWTLELTAEAALLGPFPRQRVPYEDITFIAAGARHEWLGHRDLDPRSETHPLRIETRTGRLTTVQLTHKDADKALRALRARCAIAGALDAEGREHLPASGDALAIIATRARLAALWAPMVWLSFGGGLALVVVCAWVVLTAPRDGEWGAFVGALLIGTVGGWAFATAWWKALRRMRGHRNRVQQARYALRESGSGPPPQA